MTASDLREPENPDDMNNNPGTDDEDCDEVTPPLPPDGGWGWVVVAASLINNIIVDGVCFSFGVFYVEFLDYFQESKSKTAWVGSLVPGMYLGMGPIVGALCNKYGCRMVTIIGALMAAIFFFLSTFSPNVDILIVTYGVFGGMGFGLMYLPSIVVVNFYFDKRRAFATGIAVCGSGIGTFLFAPLCHYLLDNYGWKGGNWIIAGIILHGIIAGSSFRPLYNTRPKRKKDGTEKESPRMKPKNRSIIMQKIIEEKERQRTISTGSIDGGVITNENILITDPEAVKNVRNQLLHNLEEDEKLRQSENKAKSASNADLESGIVTETYESTEENIRLLPNGTENVAEGEDGLSVVPGKRAKQFNSTPNLLNGSPPINRHLEKVKHLNFGAGGSSEMRMRSNTLGSEVKRPGAKAKDKVKRDVARPMYRKDIFYSGSVCNIAEYKSNPDMQSYVSSTTSMGRIPLPPEDDDFDGEGGEGKCTPLLAVLKSMVDFSLLKSPTFVALVMTSVLAMIGFFTPFVYVTAMAIDLGIPAGQATFLLSVLGAFNTVGRIVSGFISDYPWADCLLIHNVALILAGVATCLAPLIQDYILLATYCAVFGSCIACFIALRSIVLVDLLGLDKLTNSFGLLLLFQGLASVVGSPLAGLISDLTGGYSYAFIFSGSLIALGGVISLPVRRIAKWEENWRRDAGQHDCHEYSAPMEMNA